MQNKAAELYNYKLIVIHKISQTKRTTLQMIQCVNVKRFYTFILLGIPRNPMT